MTDPTPSGPGLGAAIVDQQQILIRWRRQSQLDDPRPVGDVPIVPAGDFTTFAYDVIAEIQDAGTGFDALRVLTTATSGGQPGVICSR